MLLSFTVENFRSIRDRQSLILEASSDTHLEHSHLIQSSPGHKVLKSAVIYGANASGKSNVINAMIWMRRFVLESISSKVESPQIAVEPFRLQEGLSEQPSIFEIEFLLDNKRFRYGFAVSKSGVEEEWLYRKGGKGKAAKIYSREKQAITTNPRQEKGLEPFIPRTRPNTLFLKVCAEFNFEFAESVMNWFRRFRYVSGLSETGFIGFTAERIADEKHRSELLEFVRKADFNICGIRSDMEPLTEKAPVKGEILTSHSVFDVDGNIVGNQEFDLEEDESQGTRKFVALAGPILHTIEEGSILLIDEFEARLHPNLTKAILQWFHGPQNNKGAQVILATHDTGLMDPELLRRDQIWFCEKDARGGTSLYCLDEFDKQEVRATTKFNRQYLQGVFGAVPQVALEETPRGEHPSEIELASRRKSGIIGAMNRDKDNLVWLDLETTGLALDTSSILEVAIIVTDAHLNAVGASIRLVPFQTDEVLAGMDEWCVDQHGRSGLTDEVRASSLSLGEVEGQLIDYLKNLCVEGASPMCGSSISFDRKFVEKYMPKLNGYLHYRNVDVSTIKELVRRWCPGLLPPKKKCTHRALDDIQESIDELAFYRGRVFIAGMEILSLGD